PSGQVPADDGTHQDSAERAEYSLGKGAGGAEKVKGQKDTQNARGGYRSYAGRV
ncbi:hypothetical protein GGH97_005298, partial [Coemansia sp. RSA 475]